MHKYQYYKGQILPSHLVNKVESKRAHAVTKHERFRHRLAEAQNWRCAYCNIRLSQDNCTVDHVIPLAHNGSNTRDNLIAACVWCNTIRETEPALDFYSRIKQHGFIYVLAQKFPQAHIKWKNILIREGYK